MDKELPTTSNFKKIVCNSIPLVDVRAPVEFNQGSFPHAVNLPLLDDDDRHSVGLCYKQHGKDAAFSLANKRVSGQKKDRVIAEWKKFFTNNPQAKIFCLRGGMRSKTAQQWLYEFADIEIVRLRGGYKAFRRYCIDSMEPENITALPIILGGRTGTGKTQLLKQLPNSIDLEGAAHHRGSTFGGYWDPQPSQIDFENRLAYQIISRENQKFEYIVVEDEGAYVGARYIPKNLAAYFRQDGFVLLESDIEDRIKVIRAEYVEDAQTDYCLHYERRQALEVWHDDMRAKIHRIRKRLGGERTQRVVTHLQEGVEEQLSGKIGQQHGFWIEILLTEYYDPMYDYQMEQRGRSILFRGTKKSVVEYLQSFVNTF